MIKRLLAVLMTIMIVSFASTSSAQATSGTGFDGTNPAYYCAASSFPIYSRNVYSGQGEYIGAVEVRYSSACGTNWVRAYGVPGMEHTDKRITRPAQAGFAYFSQLERDYPGVGWTYGMQVYAPGNTHITVSVLFVGPGWSITHTVNL